MTDYSPRRGDSCGFRLLWWLVMLLLASPIIGLALAGIVYVVGNWHGR